MKKAVQPLTAENSTFDLFDSHTQISLDAQLMVKGGDGGDDSDETGIIVEDVVDH